MKKLCKLNVYTFYGDEKWHKIMSLKFRYIEFGDFDLPVYKSNFFYDFDSAYDYLSTGKMIVASAWHTFFKKPCINYRESPFDYPLQITKKKFKPFGEKLVWEEDDEPYSIKQLAENLSPNDFIEYCKDHGMAICPLNKNQV